MFLLLITYLIILKADAILINAFHTALSSFVTFQMPLVLSILCLRHCCTDLHLLVQSYCQRDLH